MPRYTCVETISRTQYRPPDSRPANCASLIAMRRLAPSRGDLTARDRLRLDVAIVEGREDLLLGRRPEVRNARCPRTCRQRRFEPPVSSAFFWPAYSASLPRRSGMRGGATTSRCSRYNVPAAKSTYSYRAYGPGKTIGFHGTLSVDPSDSDLHQLVVEAEQFDPGDAVCACSMSWITTA